MKAFLLSFKLKEVAANLIENDVDVVYWTGTERNFNGAQKDKKQFPHTVFHNSSDVSKAMPADGVMDLNLEFPLSEIFKKFSGIEYQVLGMISRADYVGITNAEKRDLFYQYIIYWYGVLKYFKPDVIIYSDIPHTGPNYIAYSLAKILGIKVVIYRFVKGFPDRLLFFNDFRNFRALRDAYNQSLEKRISRNDLSDEMKKYLQAEKPAINNKILTHAKHIEVFIKQKEKTSRLFPKVLKNIRRFTFFKTVFNYAKMLLRKKRTTAVNKQDFYGFQLFFLRRKWSAMRKKYRKEYESLQEEPDFNKKYVYMSLHLQPECNTNPLGDEFDDQILLARTLSASLPDGWKIYIKENPMQWLHHYGQFGRYAGYYKTLKEVPNVTLAPISSSAFELIENAQAVATISGSVGLEAVVRSTPVLLFGYVWYMDCEGVLKVRDVEGCRKAFDVIQKGYKPDRNKVAAFLYVFDKISIKGYPNKKYQQFSTIPFEENIANITNLLLKKLKEI